ncbi:pyridoxal phosphate-dependent aminotransferase [Tomitella gaofuii]|uniref:pyridoxal phosphate-dependent aminotransferase n=1 Tax=Tomitella gaofuii TaxID=2760083 RepID=UPI0015FD1549|nr:pyridoxal phosphate-dependent aminotransferase [Tomitella gaofuii]
MDVLKAAGERSRTHGDLVSLAAGQPSTPAPTPVLAAARQALGSHLLGYTEALGIPELREAIARYHHERSGVAVDADDVIVTTGSSGGFTLIFLAAFDVGDTVVMARPGYPAYRNTLAALGCRVAEIDCGADTRFQPTVEMLEEHTRRTGAAPAGLIVASPANPTGTVIDPDGLTALARWCEEHGTLLISDEIYHGIEFSSGSADGAGQGGADPGGAAAPAPPATSSAWETSREAVVMGSVSKYFSMTGWRLGWMLVPRGLRRAVDRLTGNMNICPPALSQVAGVAAFSPESRTELDAHVRRYARNRTLMLEGLPAIGIDDLAPADGAFYVYADIGHLTDDALRWCTDLLRDTGVAVTPGVDFDTRRGGRTVRMSFAGAEDEIAEALHRMGRHLPGRG